MQLKGKTALITGASSGLGRHFAHLLAREGARVIAAARRVDALAALSDEIERQGGTCIPIAMDVTDPAAVAAAFEQIERSLAEPLSIVVNNAGVAHTSAALDLSTSEWEQVLQPNLTGAFLVAQHAARMMRNEGGTIVNIASILGERVSKGLAAYATSKAGLIQLTKALALEWAALGIRVNALAPGYIETDLNRDFFASDAGLRLISRIPQKRLGQLHDLDGPLLLLCSDQSRYMTGAVIAVDGGHLVSGHVDGVGKVLSLHQDARSWHFRVEAPAELAKYIAEKGSITVDGTSLTVNAVEGAVFHLNIVPHTLQETVMGDYQPGTVVNLEVDLIARYLERLLLGEKAAEPTSSGISMAFLAENGFLKS